VSGVRLIGSSAAVLASACALVACGGSGARERVVARVGHSAITAAAFTHWMQAMAPQHVAPDPPHYAACIARQKALEPQSTEAALLETCRQQYQTLKQQVLGFLISSRWLIGEAADQGIGTSEPEVKRRLAEKQRSLAASDAEFKQSLNAIDHTIADLELEIRVEVASQKIRQKLIGEEPKVTPGEVAAYYRRNIQRFHVPERRYFDIAENFHSAALARKQMREVAAGKYLESLHESLPRKPFTDYNGEKRTIYEAIFKARPRVVTGPIRLNRLYFLIRVTRVAPAYVQPLAQVQGAIGKKLSAARQRRTLAAFIAAWRRKWIARTDCDAGYVVQKCRQYAASKTPEEPLALN
jgi:foldase protein PrsA